MSIHWGGRGHGHGSRWPKAAGSAIQQLFQGTGRVALMVLGQNAQGINTFGAMNGTTYFSRRAGSYPIYVMLKEISPNVWMGYEFSSHTNGHVFLASYGIYKPMKRVRYDNAAFSYLSILDAPIVASYPQTTAVTKSLTFNTAGVDTTVTRLAVVVGFTGNNSGVQIAELTNNADASTVVPNLLSNGTQAAARSAIASSALVSNGGAIPDASYIFGTNTNDVIRMAQNRACTIPVADNLTAGSYSFKMSLTTVPGNGGGTVDRTYIAYGLYGTASMTHTDAGAELYRVGYVAALVDASANERCTLAARKAGTASARTLMGGGHGLEADTSLAWTVDGVATALFANTVSRARASNVATIVFDRTVSAQTGDTFSMSGLNSGAASSYNVEGVTIASVTTTTLPSDTITYANTGSNESTTADTAGRFFLHKVVIGSEVKLTQATTYTHATDGLLATGSYTHTLDSLKMAIRGTITCVEDLETDGLQTYATLSTMWGGSRTTYGPGMGGRKIWADYGDTAGVRLTAGDNSQNLLDPATGGYIAWDDEGGYVSAVIEAPGLVKYRVFAQDRSPENQGVDKSYWPRTSGNGTIADNTVITVGLDRYDNLVSPSTINPLLPTA
jgi:hypothetical protein